MTSLILPRPIAFVTTVSPSGEVNLAPFSYFNAVCSSPPVISIAIGRRKGERKDTARNLFETGEAVVNVSTVALAEAVNKSAGDWPRGVDETEVCGLETAPSMVVRPPRLAASPINLECVLLKAIEEEPLTTTLFLLRVVQYHVAESVLNDQGAIDARKFDPLGRLGHGQYAGLGEVIAYDRPRIDYETGEVIAPGGAKG
ncbi:MAG: flavin reductase family protein [Planctomycetota bacterium]